MEGEGPGGGAGTLLPPPAALASLLSHQVAAHFLSTWGREQGVARDAPETEGIWGGSPSEGLPAAAPPREKVAGAAGRRKERARVQSAANDLRGKRTAAVRGSHGRSRQQMFPAYVEN